MLKDIGIPGKKMVMSPKSNNTIQQLNVTICNVEGVLESKSERG